MSPRAINPDRTNILFRAAYREVLNRHTRRWPSQPCLTFEEFKEKVVQPCIYCGFVGSNTFRDRNPRGGRYSEVELHINGIDRQDNSRGYSTDNSNVVCKYCNMGKAQHKESFFLHWVAEVYHKSVKGTEHDSDISECC